jgi:pimeloyl-ACP methyl ester carboxylesterase
MTTPDRIVIFSHGFGVRKDDRGLLTDIASALPEVVSVLFDYNEVDEGTHTLTIRPLSAQATILNDVVSETRRVHPSAIIDLIGHSQGTIVAALAKPIGVRKTLFLAPPFDMMIERTMERYSKRLDVEINLNGISRLSILDGWKRLVPAAYWKERENIDPFSLYNTFAKQTELIIIEARQDEILPKVDLAGLSSAIETHLLDGAHNFGGGARKPLLDLIREYLL